jgi:hypothetical protein
MAITLKPIRQETITLTIQGISPLIEHAWDHKSIIQMQEKHAGKKTKTRAERKPEEEFKAATYFDDDGDYAVPAMAVKAAMVSAAHKDIGIEKTLLRKALFLHCSDSNNLIKLKTDDPIMRTDTVRVGAGSTDLRYRPEFRNWSAEVSFTFDAELLTIDDVVNLLDRAGFGCGIGEWRPQKGGEFGRFRVDHSKVVRHTGSKAA